MVLVTAALMGLGSVARAASLAEHLPAGALLTLETHNAAGALDRLTGLGLRAAEAFGAAKDMADTANGFKEILKGSVGKEAVLGVFSVSTGKGKFSPEVLAVTKADELATEFLTNSMPKKAGAKVGVYSFSRQGDSFIGKGGGLVFMSTNKDLLMSYLGRLSGRQAPRLLNSTAYTTPSRAMGVQELSLFMNFSAMAKVARGYLADMMVPRLLSPLVDALDTLGQFAGGFTTTPAGLTAQSAHLPNPQGKDRPLLNILTHTADFHVQDMIPGNVEQVQASACDPDSGPYLGRWLTRLDLFDPTGFLTDSQLSSHLERSARYLADECAQVTLAGSMRSGLDPARPLGSLDYSVSYQRVRDLDAAKAHMPEYVASVNQAIQGLAASLKPLLADQKDIGKVAGSLPSGLRGAGGALTAGLPGAELGDLLGAVGKIKMVYAFRGDYLITAFSDQALKVALAETPDTLAQNTEFKAANLTMTGSAGWTYQPNLPDLSARDFQTLMQSQMTGVKPSPSDKQMLDKLSGVMTDLLNRYDGMISQRSAVNTPQGQLMLNTSSVTYRW